MDFFRYPYVFESFHAMPILSLCFKAFEYSNNRIIEYFKNKQKNPLGMVEIKDLSDDEIIKKLGSLRHNRDMGYPISPEKIAEFAAEAEKRGLQTW